MEALTEPLIEISGISISIWKILASAGIGAVGFGLYLYLRYLIGALQGKDAISLSQRRVLVKITGWLIGIISTLLILNTFNLDVANILGRIGNAFEYELFKSNGKPVRIMNVVIAITIVFAAWLVLRWVRRLLAMARHRKRLTVGQEFAYIQVTRYLVIILAFALILFSFHIKITALLLGSTALLLGLGLGLQQVFNDFVSGFFLLMENSVRVNDIIEVSNFVCKVKEIGVRTSKVMTRDGIIVVIPNSKIISDSVINWSMNGTTTRFNLTVGVAYGSDTQKVKKILLDCAGRHQEVAKNPKPICRFTNFGDSALHFELLFWSRSRFRIEDVKSDLRFMVDSEFRKNNVRIPFPQHDIHIRTDLTKNPPESDGFPM